MKKSIKFYLIVSLTFFCVNNLFSEVNKNGSSYNVKKSTVTSKQQQNKVYNNNVENLLQKEQNSVAYLVLDRQAPKQYRITGKIKKDKQYNSKKNSNDTDYFITGSENKTVSKDKSKYPITGLEKNKNNKFVLNDENVSETQKESFNKTVKKGTVYNLTGAENRFNLTYTQRQKIYDINGTEEINENLKKNTFTKLQQEQLKNIEMEKKYKILVLDKEIASRRKSLDEELAKENFDIYFINKLSDEIKQLVVDKETITINADKKIRYVLSPKQYIEYKEKQKKSKKK